MAIEEDPPAGVPDWVLTYGDMMSLLLTFFIMLVSMSELKKDDKFQGVADSLHEQFGYESSQNSLAPGDYRARNSEVAALAMMGRSKRKAALEGGAEKKSSAGEFERVRNVRSGDRTAVGTVITFSGDGAELTEEHKIDIRRTAPALQGKPQKIEIRGHASRKPPADGGDPWDLAYRRARNTMRFMADELEFSPHRFRVTTAGSFEPPTGAAGVAALDQAPRVEIFLLDESAPETQPGAAGAGGSAGVDPPGSEDRPPGP